MSSRSWAAYPSSYRAKEIAILAGWIRAGESGSVIGLAGAGKSNLLGFLCHRPEVIRSYLLDDAFQPVLALVDLHNLPGGGTPGSEAIFYRVILRALYEARAQLVAIEHPLGKAVETLYRRVEDKTDPFLSQGALREALLLFQERDARLVLVLDPFDSFCQTATPQALDGMRGLRDSFKATLSYLIGLRQELESLRDPMEMGALYEILDTHRCLLGAMEAEDAHWVIRQVEETIGRSFAQAEIERLIEVTGGYPSLLRTACLWSAEASSLLSAEAWLECLLAERSVQHRLEEVWTGLTEEEQGTLSEMYKRQPLLAAQPVGAETAEGKEALGKAFRGLEEQRRRALRRLEAWGLCRRAGGGWRICGDLLAAYVGSVGGRGGERIWLNEETDELYRGRIPLTNLTPLERAVLVFLTRYPRVRHTKTDLIANAWPDELCRQGITDDSLYQVIRGLRTKIEPISSKPRYIITWRGTGAQEGGYQFFPQGR
jgi:hypothetical protein